MTASEATREVQQTEEQGADFFVGPLSGQWLQDNYEDNFVHQVCMQATQAAGTPVYLLQTQTELDLERGIPEEELNINIFERELKTGAFSQKIHFPEGLKELLNGQGQPIKTPTDVLGLAITGTRSLATSALTQQPRLLLNLVLLLLSMSFLLSLYTSRASTWTSCYTSP